MDISEIKHIAKLSYLALPEEELEKFADELIPILDHISQLNNVDLAGVTPTTQIMSVSNVFRDDDIVAEKEEKLIKDLMDATPDIEGGYVKVKAIL